MHFDKTYLIDLKGKLVSPKVFNLGIYEYNYN